MIKLKQSIKHYLSRSISWSLRGINYTHKKKINGVPIYIPSINGIKCTITEPWMFKLLGILLKKSNGVFIDVGVNVGQTLVKLKTLSKNADYIGFEPNPACVYYVNELIKKNNFPNCSILPVGLYDQDHVLSLELYSSHTTDASASLIKNFRPNNRVIEKIYVPVFNFNNISNLFNLEKVSIIKIDVEGAELEVIKSLLDLIKIQRPIILLEILPVYTDQASFRRDRQKEIEDIFHDIDYAFYRVIKVANNFSSLAKIDSVGVHSSLAQCDYVVAPKELTLDF